MSVFLFFAHICARASIQQPQRIFGDFSAFFYNTDAWLDISFIFAGPTPTLGFCKKFDTPILRVLEACMQGLKTI